MTYETLQMTLALVFAFTVFSVMPTIQVYYSPRTNYDMEPDE